MNTSARTELVLLIDRSGSIASIKKETEKALNDFITAQKALPGVCKVSLYQFDNVYETVFESKDVKDVGSIEIVPRGGTALLDALGRTINSIDERLASATDDCPDTVVVAVLTDGQENESKEFTAATIKSLIETKTNAHGWKFVYFGTNQDAISTAMQYGFAAGSSISFAGSAKGLMGASAAMTSAVTAYRSCADYSFNAQDRAMAMGDSSPLGVTKEDIQKLVQSLKDDAKDKTP